MVISAQSRIGEPSSNISAVFSFALTLDKGMNPSSLLASAMT